MQHHAGVGPVGRVAMRRPTVRIQVQLHVADDHGTAGKAEPRALEIRAAQEIPLPGMPDTHTAAIERDQAGQVKVSPQPDFLKQLFRK